ncbi:MAG: 3-hydroxyacyl-CoA dehydrogenase NAD-binding domain-containing protein [Rhodomicrobiaceae bacterium]
MTAPVQLSTDGAIAIIRIDNPPVNALNHVVRTALHDALEKARDDAAVQAIVVGSNGSTFSGGADITEFGKPPLSPTLLDLIDLVEAIEKPTVVAVQGVAFGGGLEMALAFHFRVAGPEAQFGLPEVKIGLLPGAGGTQRLPRAIGMMEALKVIVTGDPIGAEKARDLGLVDVLADGDPIAEAGALARRAVSEKLPLGRVRDRQDKLEFDRGEFDSLAGSLMKRARGLDAPLACVRSVRNAAMLTFDAGLKQERELFIQLLNSEQSKAQRHVFFAERAARKVPDMPASVEERKIERVAVIGGGTMGRGIAMSFANASIPVTITETSEAALLNCLAAIKETYRSGAARGAMTDAEAQERIDLIRGATALDAVRDADLIIEAVFEEMALKKSIFRELDRLAKPGAVLATNTSTLDVDAIAAETQRPGDVVGMHFFSPANIMKLLEIVRGKATAVDTLKTAMAVGQRIGKVGVISGVCDGFIGNRMLHKRFAQVERLLIEGALPQEIDAALTEFGFAMGPCAVGDLAGLDVGWRIRKERGTKAAISDALCEAGRFGQKTGKGYYLYEPGSRVPRPDPEVERLILETSKRLGVERRPISKEEIVERTIYPMINEGARILEEGIAMRSGDIDVVWIYGYGWPVARGGPMFYADQVGLGVIAGRLGHYADELADKTLAPAPLLARLAAEGKGFGSLSAKA